MKKILFAAAAAFALVACEQEKVTEVPQDLAISFGQTFVEGTYYRTKVADPSTTTESITGFNVWGYMKNTNAVMFNGDEVTKVGDEWTYGELQYWTPNNTYYFAALAPMNSANWKAETAGANAYGLGVVSFDNVDGTEDLLYASACVTTPDLATMTAMGVEPVKLNFSHLLSKVKFTFVNGFATDNASIVVKNVQMTAPAAGTIDLAVANWWDNDDWKLGNGTVSLAFGDVAELAAGAGAASAAERLTIPADGTYEYNVTFTVELYIGGTLAMTADKEVKVSDVALNMSKGYNFKAIITPEHLGLLPIVFEVEEVKDWVDAGDVQAK